MIQLQLGLDTKELAGLAQLVGKQKLAAAKALTFTAEDAQRALQADVPAHFVTRNDFVQKGIRKRAATPGSMTAEVGTIDKFMERHVVGKRKDAARGLSIRSKRDSHGRYGQGGLFIWPYGSIGSMPTHTVVRRRVRRWEGNKFKPFHVRSGGRILIVRRTSRKRYPLKTLGVLQQSAAQSPVWDFAGTVRAVVAARFAGHYYRAMAKI